MNGTAGLRGLIARLPGRRAVSRTGALDWTPEAERMRSALEMHDPGVKLYRQRMRREHPRGPQGDRRPRAELADRAPA